MTKPKSKPAATKRGVTAKRFIGRSAGAANVARTSAGLREALFQEIESLRGGKSDAHQAMAVAKLAQQIVNSVRVEIEFASKIKPGDIGRAQEMPTPLQLVKEGEQRLAA